MENLNETMSVHGDIYINGISCISPQPTFDNALFLEEIKVHSQNKIYTVEPDYAKFLDAIAIRRMSRIVKFGTTAGLMALKESGTEKPDAISTATGYGLLEMSQRFLQDCVASGEGIVSPTTFIQSTHNTVSSNIAIIIGCNAHNNTFSQKGFSFESTLYDAFLLMKEGAKKVLVGAYEETGEFNYASMLQANELKQQPCNNLETFNYENDGNILGEGAAFFVLENEKRENTYGKLIGFHTFLSGDDSNIPSKEIELFFQKQGITLSDVDIVLTGINGKETYDKSLLAVTEKLFPASTIAAFKHLCGEYMTASAFAFWLVAKMLKTNSIPDVLVLKNANRKPKTILIYNQYLHYHSLILFKHV